MFNTIGVSARKAKAFIDSPIISKNINRQNGERFRVHFKLDCVQPSGSFKDRGIANMIYTLLDRGPISRLICSSGGNAGHAVATCGERLGIPVDVFVPKTTMPMMINILKARGANVHIGGDNWNGADVFARQALEKDPNQQYIPPFDHPLIWTGNSTIVDELINHFGIENPPDDIVLSVGGGGLLRGVQEGLERVGGRWAGVRIIATETDGAGSFAAAKAAGKVVKLDKISSIATSLGALSVVPSTLSSPITTLPYLVSDRDAVIALSKFLELYRILVEPACGAALAPLLCDHLLNGHPDPSLPNSHPPSSPSSLWDPLSTDQIRNVVVVACGGSAVNLDLFSQWRDKVQLK